MNTRLSSIIAPGDIVLTLGETPILSGAIAKTNNGYSHASLIVEVNPLTLAESIPPVVHEISLAQRLRESKQAMLLHALDLTYRERIAVVASARHYLGRAYGFSAYPKLIFDTLFKTDFWGRHIHPHLDKYFPICSILVGLAYETIGRNFDEPSQGLQPGEIFSYARSHTKEFQCIPLPCGE